MTGNINSKEQAIIMAYTSYAMRSGKSLKVYLDYFKEEVQGEYKNSTYTVKRSESTQNQNGGGLKHCVVNLPQKR